MADNSLIMGLTHRPESLRWCVDRIVGGPLGEVRPPRAQGSSTIGTPTSEPQGPTPSPFVGGVSVRHQRRDQGVPKSRFRETSAAASTADEHRERRVRTAQEEERRRKFEEELLKSRSKLRELTKLVEERGEAAMRAKQLYGVPLEQTPTPNRKLEDPRTYLSLGGEVGRRRTFEEILKTSCDGLTDRGLAVGGEELRNATEDESLFQANTQFDRDLVWSYGNHSLNEKT